MGRVSINNYYTRGNFSTLEKNEHINVFSAERKKRTCVFRAKKPVGEILKITMKFHG